jgi:hypothetical protein
MERANDAKKASTFYRSPLQGIARRNPARFDAIPQAAQERVPLPMPLCHYDTSG